MKNLYNIESVVQKQISKGNEPEKFSYNDLTNALFFNTQPVLYIKPFKDFNNLLIKEIKFSLPLFLFLEPSPIKNTLEKAFFKDEKIISLILSLPPWMVGRIIEKYSENIKKWSEYVISNLKEYCKTLESKWKWSILKILGKESIFKGELTYEQLLWIWFNTNLDKEEQIDLILKIKDSLLPWFNYDLWEKIEKKKENTRENVFYKEIKDKILYNSYINEDELDIIE